MVVAAVGLARNGFVGLSVGGAGSVSPIVQLVLRPAFTNPLPDDCSTEPYDESLLFLSTLTCCAFIVLIIWYILKPTRSRRLCNRLITTVLKNSAKVYQGWPVWRKALILLKTINVFGNILSHKFKQFKIYFNFFYRYHFSVFNFFLKTTLILNSLFQITIFLDI